AAAGDIPAETVAALRQMMATASSEETLTQGFAEQWGGMVGFWAGAELDLGYTYVMETEEPSPLIPGLVVPMEIEFGAYERTPCHDEAAPDSCVLLEFVSVPDAEVAGPAVEGWLRQIMGPSVDFTLLSMVQENVIQVVVEPGTLIPHAYYTSRVVEMEMEISGAIQGERREDETEVFFRYRR
ncbi:MAG TPA: hypothetical protein VLA43_12190, partial [Longimicrobiales bacterium]|nr:hypothetical protein [Longimicrobiales bacterium]